MTNYIEVEDVQPGQIFHADGAKWLKLTTVPAEAVDMKGSRKVFDLGLLVKVADKGATITVSQR